jgi:hypothetical protein
MVDPPGTVRPSAAPATVRTVVNAVRQWRSQFASVDG